MNVAAVMNELGERLDTIAGLRVHPYQAKKITPPAAIVSLPDKITYDATYGRGADTMTIPITVLVGMVSDRASRTAISQYTDGSGTSSVKQILDTGSYTSCDTVTVTEAEFEVIKVAAVDYLAAVFTVDIEGSGA